MRVRISAVALNAEQRPFEEEAKKSYASRLLGLSIGLFLGLMLSVALHLPAKSPHALNAWFAIPPVLGSAAVYHLRRGASSQTGPARLVRALVVFAATWAAFFVGSVLIGFVAGYLKGRR